MKLVDTYGKKIKTRIIIKFGHRPKVSCNLNWISYECRYAAAKLLMSFGADPDLPDVNGEVDITTMISCTIFPIRL